MRHTGDQLSFPDVISWCYQPKHPTIFRNHSKLAALDMANSMQLYQKPWVGSSSGWQLQRFNMLRCFNLPQVNSLWLYWPFFSKPIGWLKKRLCWVENLQSLNFRATLALQIFLTLTCFCQSLGDNSRHKAQGNTEVVNQWKSLEINRNVLHVQRRNVFQCINLNETKMSKKSWHVQNDVKLQDFWCLLQPVQLTSLLFHEGVLLSNLCQVQHEKNMIGRRLSIQLVQEAASSSLLVTSILNSASTTDIQKTVLKNWHRCKAKLAFRILLWRISAPRRPCNF